MGEITNFVCTEYVSIQDIMTNPETIGSTNVYQLNVIEPTVLRTLRNLTNYLEEGREHKRKEDEREGKERQDK